MACSVTKGDGTIDPSQMRDGQMGVIESWTSYENRVGQVVQRGEGNLLFALGVNDGGRYPNACRDTATTGCRIRLLSRGDTIRIDSFETS